MKEFILLFAALFCISANAQNNPGNMPELLVNKEVKVLPLPSYDAEKGYTDFYDSNKMLYHYKGDKKFRDNTPPSAVEGRTFKVAAVERYKDLGRDKVRLLLTDGQETVYYHYDADYGFYPFEVIGGIDYTDAFYDGYIKPYEDIDGSKGFETVDRNYELITFQKQKGKTSKYIMTVQVSSDKKADGRKGLVIHFENGTDLSFPKAQAHDWSRPTGFRTVVTLSNADVEALKSNKITGYTLLDEKEKVYPDNAHYIRGVFNRLQAK